MTPKFVRELRCAASCTAAKWRSRTALAFWCIDAWSAATAASMAVAVALFVGSGGVPALVEGLVS